jgi:branched-chain amino acid transport system ATP-binding protein
MLQIEGLSVKIQNLTILRDVSIAVPKGKIVSLVGRNGAGKTTTMRSVLGLTKINSGTIKLNDIDLCSTPVHNRVNQGIGYMPEDRRIIPPITVEENIIMSTWSGKHDNIEERLAKVYEQLPEVKAFSKRTGAQLSGGQQKLVALARAMFTARTLLLLDEPFEGVAPALVDRMWSTIRDYMEDLPILVSTSEYTEVEQWSDKAYVIDRGEIIEAKEGAMT